MQPFTTVLLIFSILCIVVIIILVILYSDKSSNTIKASQCPQIGGEFAIIPNVTPSKLKIQNRCTVTPDGSLGNSVCSFTANDLYTAIAICNRYTSNVCDAFSYDTGNKVMSMVVSGYPIVSSNIDNSSNPDLYIRQN